MVSRTDFRKSKRFEHKSTVMLTDEHSTYFSYGQMFNFSRDGLYFRSDFSFKTGKKIQIRFNNPPFRSGPKSLSSVVKWCRKLAGYEPDYTYGIGVKFV
jgi:hypothetical protein